MNIVKKNITKCKIVNKVRDQYMYIIIQFKKSKGRGVLTRNVSLYLNRPITFCKWVANINNLFIFFPLLGLI